MKKIRLTQKLNLNKTTVTTLNNHEMVTANGGLYIPNETHSKDKKNCTSDTYSQEKVCTPTNYTFGSRVIPCDA